VGLPVICGDWPVNSPKTQGNLGFLAAFVSSEVAGTRYALPSGSTLTVVWDPSQNDLEEL